MAIIKNDILIKDDNDLLIQNGDFVIAESTKTQAKFITLANKGEIRQYPLLGVAVTKYIGSSLPADVLFNLVRNELISDGIELSTFSLNNNGNKVTIDLEVE